MWNWAGLDGFTLYKVIRIAVRPVKGEFWKLSAQRDGGGRQWEGVFVSLLKWQLRSTPWHPPLLRILRRLSFEEAKFRANLSLLTLAP